MTPAICVTGRFLHTGTFCTGESTDDGEGTEQLEAAGDKGSVFTFASAGDRQRSFTVGVFNKGRSVMNTLC